MQISNEEYLQFKPLLFSIGYRMLGSVTEAEDIVHDTFLKAYQIDEEKIKNKKAFLCKILTNRCLDFLKSARFKREQYIGPWNPEPLLLECPQLNNPSEVLLEKEGLSIAYLRMMENLSPDERAVLLLKEVFGFQYEEIAEMVEKKEDNCRKIFSRAKLKIAAVEGESLDYTKNKSIVDRFIKAFQLNNLNTLLELVSESVTLYSDGGGKVKAAVRPILSRTNVLAFLNGIVSKAQSDFTIEVKNVNGQPAIIVYMEGTIHSTISFYILHNRINEIYITMNPKKLVSIRE
ncbi:RNA polymerase sigma factor SigJ [Bacillus sp. FJAT-27225]|nr:RNA polymerase sigma-70 factor [Bacillus sp. FJAT-27225]OCA83102.1 RNA polymerase sigma factor SigJ [Bacillus sp. FJAT-27225]